uniref:Tumor necrosis factor alpha-induced protein 8-like protein 1 n=1 Tax=Oryzias sinensis TaxID=183150 RepID=A0A8C7X717_9TELE
MDSFSTKSLALQAQKKLMSKMATKSMANLFIDDTSSEVLDELYRVTKEYTHNRKESQKIIKNLIKVVVKLGVLYRNNQFNSEELVLVENFRYEEGTPRIFCLVTRIVFSEEFLETPFFSIFFFLPIQRVFKFYKCLTYFWGFVFCSQKEKRIGCLC